MSFVTATNGGLPVGSSRIVLGVPLLLLSGAFRFLDGDGDDSDNLDSVEIDDMVMFQAHDVVEQRSDGKGVF